MERNQKQLNSFASVGEKTKQREEGDTPKGHDAFAHQGVLQAAHLVETTSLLTGSAERRPFCGRLDSPVGQFSASSKMSVRFLLTWTTNLFGLRSRLDGASFGPPTPCSSEHKAEMRMA
jgi:hypothetical protein